jgi:hypothetical protein
MRRSKLWLIWSINAHPLRLGCSGKIGVKVEIEDEHEPLNGPQPIKCQPPAAAAKPTCANGERQRRRPIGASAVLSAALDMAS